MLDIISFVALMSIINIVEHYYFQQTQQINDIMFQKQLARFHLANLKNVFCATFVYQLLS